MFNIDNGILYTGIALVLFYVYLAWLRGRKRRLRRQAVLEMSKAHGTRKKELAAGLSSSDNPTYQVRSWVLLVSMMVILCLSLLIRNGDLLSQYKDYWWVASVFGVIGFALCIK